MTPTDPLLSICIPTHSRPAELAEAVASALALSVRPLELLIGDDSPAGDERTATLLEHTRQQLPAGITLQVWRHSPPLGQVRNVDALLRASPGQWVCLLHDDDRLVPAGIERLLSQLQRQPHLQAGFGLQMRLGADGWIARGALVRQLGYREGAADAGDFDFGLRLAQVSQAFWSLHQPCCDYRLSPQAVSTGRAAQFPLQAYRILEQLPCTGPAASARSAAGPGAWPTCC
jgi:glycosyltransferase involved in cell wall biosynthesis